MSQNVTLFQIFGTKLCLPCMFGSGSERLLLLKSLMFLPSRKEIKKERKKESTITSCLPQPFVPACPMPCTCLCVGSVCACLPYLCLHRFEFSDFCVRSARWACASKLVHACALLLCNIQRGCARALLSMWVHACFFPAACNEHWVLISFGDI